MGFDDPVSQVLEHVDGAHGNERIVVDNQDGDQAIHRR